MPRIPELERKNTEEWLIPCDCHDPHFFRLSWDKSTGSGYGDIEYVQGNPGWGFYGVGQRIKNAWDAFRSPSYTCASVVLNREAIKTLTDFVDARWDWASGEVAQVLREAADSETVYRERSKKDM